MTSHFDPVSGFGAVLAAVALLYTAILFIAELYLKKGRPSRRFVSTLQLMHACAAVLFAASGIGVVVAWHGVWTRAYPWMVTAIVAVAAVLGLFATMIVAGILERHLNRQA